MHVEYENIALNGLKDIAHHINVIVNTQNIAGISRQTQGIPKTGLILD